jgi:regulator of replication initiation timing
LEGRLEGVRKQYRKDLEALKLQREGLVKEITELKEHRDIFLEETTALNARNEELAELNAQIQRQVEQQFSSRPSLPYMNSSGTVPTQLSLGSSLKDFGAKPRVPSGTGNDVPSVSVSSMGTVTSMQSSATATTSNMSTTEEKEREKEDTKVVRVQTPQEPVATTGAKGGFKWLKAKAPPKEPAAQGISSGKATQSERTKGSREHNFVQQSVLRFARCDHCGDKMWGMQSRCSSEYLCYFLSLRVVGLSIGR